MNIVVAAAAMQIEQIITTPSTFYIFMRKPFADLKQNNSPNSTQTHNKSGGQLLEIRLLDTFGRKSIARHKIYQLLESG
jgi:hypothetical protein